MKGIIYKYTFPDGKVYIGQTRRHPEVRKREHLDASVGPTNTGFWDAFKKFGEPQYEEIFEVELEDLDELVNVLNAAETYYIQYYGADLPQFGYNKKSYGTIGTGSKAILHKKFEELFEEISEQRLQLYNSAVNKIWKTHLPLTDEEKYLIKEKYREENIFQSHIEEYDLDNLPRKIKNDFMFEEALDNVYKLIMEEVEAEVIQIINENQAQIINFERSQKTILQLDKLGNVVREFKSFNEICHAFNVPRADNVRNVLRGKQKTAYGFLWKYKNI